VNDRKAEFAIIGAGPAGSRLASRLAGAGRDVLLFDPKGAWEKPCGGGVTSRALKEYPFLLESPSHECNQIERLVIVSSRDRRIRVKLRYPFAVYSRRTLNGLLLERALDAGARFIRESVTGFRKIDGAWRITDRSGQEWRADYLVGADGAASFIRRRLIGSFPVRDVALAIGYNLAVRQGVTNGSRKRRRNAAASLSTVTVRFPRGFRGYFWVFPRLTEINFGAACKLGDRTGEQLRALLREFMTDYLAGDTPDPEDLSFFAAKIPILDRETWPTLKTGGNGWALIGDAAGFADPITGEGIYYALKSADLLVEALTGFSSEGPDGSGVEIKDARSMQAGACISAPLTESDAISNRYNSLWRSGFGDELERASQMLDKFYNSRFWGLDFNDAMVGFAKYHAGIRNVMVRSIVGEQSYMTLKEDLLRSLPRIF
jgi:flavin-dependent dehydrogenase